MIIVRKMPKIFTHLVTTDVKKRKLNVFQATDVYFPLII
jgi:hypothetical protein